jgi:hypothetical protein
LDKIKLSSDFQAKEFSLIIELIQSNGGMICATSNLGEMTLQRALGVQYGPSLVRRLIGSRLNPDTPDEPTNDERGGFLVDFWKGTIKKNYNLPPPNFEGQLSSSRSYAQERTTRGSTTQERTPTTTASTQPPPAETDREGTLSAEHRGERAGGSQGGYEAGKEYPAWVDGLSKRRLSNP